MNFARVPRSVSISIDTERNRRNDAVSSAVFALRAKNKKETPKETEAPFGNLGLRHGDPSVLRTTDRRIKRRPRRQSRHRRIGDGFAVLALRA